MVEPASATVGKKLRYCSSMGVLPVCVTSSASVERKNSDAVRFFIIRIASDSDKTNNAKYVLLLTLANRPMQLE